MNKPYVVIFTGELILGADLDTVKGNLVLMTGLTEAKVAKLFEREGEVVLKHFASTADAEYLADRFYQAGIICDIRDCRLTSSNPGHEVGGESSLVRLLKHFGGSSSRRTAARRKQA
ncbi:MAG: hypothetical protein OEZ16_08275 [Chromatiales bacterium]|nr:hypothetical protein [Chromatiales bacterium]